MADPGSVNPKIEEFHRTVDGGEMSIDDIRAKARERFKERVVRGDQLGCECHDADGPTRDLPDDVPSTCVTGVRFVDSGQVFYFDACGLEVKPGDWVVVESSRGREAAKVVIAPHQVVASQLQGDLKPIERILSDDDLATFERFRKESAVAVRRFSAAIREHGLPMKPISAEYTFDGSLVTLSFSSSERFDSRELVRHLERELGCRVELRQVGTRDEARLLGGLGKCGRTLCCATWLPMFPEVNMGMAKTQELGLNPSKVSGVCGRLLCCLSYENDQYRRMKAVMPRLGQPLETPRGPGSVIAMQILKDLVTVRLEQDGTTVEFPAAELGFGEAPAPKPQVKRNKPEAEVKTPAPVVAIEAAEVAPAQTASETPEISTDPGASRSSKRRRRRRSRSKTAPES